MGMVEQGGPKSVGKKPPSRKHSNLKSQPVNEYVDIFDRGAHAHSETLSQVQSSSQTSFPSMAAFTPWEPTSTPRTTSTTHNICDNAVFSQQVIPPSSSGYRLEIPPSHPSSCYSSPFAFQAATPTSTAIHPQHYHSVVQQPPEATLLPERHANSSHLATPGDPRICSISQPSASVSVLHNSTPPHLSSGALGLNASNTFSLKGFRHKGIEMLWL